MTDTKLAAPVTDLPTEAGPPEPASPQPRTEYVDYLYIDHGDIIDSKARANPPRCDIYVDDSADVLAAVTALLARDNACVLFPFLFLKPAVVDDFVAAVVLRQLTQQKTRVSQDPQNPRLRWNMTEPAALAWLERSLRDRIHPVGEMEGGWTVAIFGQDYLDGPNEKGIRVEQLRTAGGRAFTPQEDLQAAILPPDVPILPERERELVGQLREHIAQAARSWEYDQYGKVEDWLPSVGVLCMWLAKQRAEAAGEAPPVEVAPDPKLAAEVEAIIGKYFDEKGRGPSRQDIDKRSGVRHGKPLTEALAWLTRPGGTITRHHRGR